MSRVIRKSQNASVSEVADLLAGLFSAELCSPSRCLWLVSPWISDVEIIDNSASSFDPLARFGKRRIRLVELLAGLAGRGVHVVIGTTTDEHNTDFAKRLQAYSTDLRVRENVTVAFDPHDKLHTKALTGDDFALTGSMNITFNGIQLREEQVDLRTDEAFVAQARMDAYDRFGGIL